MDFSQVYESGDLCDIELILMDNQNQKSIKLHKLVLYMKSPFFQKLFTSSFEEKDKSQIIMKIPNVDVCVDVIKSFYNINVPKNDHWKYQLSNYLTKQYLLLECKLPEKINVPENEFDDFLNITQSLEYNDELINLIADNLPHNYNLDNLSIELIKEINQKYFISQLLITNDNGIYILDMNSGDYSKILEGKYHSTDYIKELGIFITKKKTSLLLLEHKKPKFICRDLSGKEIYLDETNEKIKSFNEKIDMKNIKYIEDFIKTIGDDLFLSRYHYNKDYSKIVFIASKYINQYRSKCLNYIYIFDQKIFSIEEIYRINEIESFESINDFVFVDNGLILNTNSYYSSTVYLFSMINKIITTIHHIKRFEYVEIKYNGNDLILLSKGNKSLIYNLTSGKVIKKIKKLHKFEFITEEIIVDVNYYVEGSEITIFKIMTDTSIKKIVDIPIKHLVPIPSNNIIKNKLTQYLNGLNN
ncbi:BTB family protein [Moumouvirus australiensis]|uniref:BTB family protein n=1 Tax=Moumouvirus australiensis TaxID=2109587 RepID=A0A2P1EMQ3_9VIRU|nr:BTB family protein [Moumouvirus australiensis]AVL95161.1 BTB family protein [Moumouvirus australiensis]